MSANGVFALVFVLVLRVLVDGYLIGSGDGEGKYLRKRA